MSDTQSGDKATIELPEPQPRDAFRARLQALQEFLDKHPALPAPATISFGETWTSASIYVDSRADLDAMAGYFGQPAPAAASHYNGAQFSVDAGPLHVTVSFHQRGQNL